MDDLGKIIFATGFKKLPKVQKIAQSGHTPHRSLPKTRPIHTQARFNMRFKVHFRSGLLRFSTRVKNVICIRSLLLQNAQSIVNSVAR